MLANSDVQRLYTATAKYGSAQTDIAINALDMHNGVIAGGEPFIHDGARITVNGGGNGNHAGNGAALANNGFGDRRSIHLGALALNSRLYFIIAIVLTITCFIVLRLVYINTTNANFLSNEMNVRVMRNISLPAMRGDIVDRNNNPLAISTKVASIWVDPSDLGNLTLSKLNSLARILGMSVNDINQKLNQKNKTFVYLKRSVTPQQAQEVKSLDITGIYSLDEYKRYYPTSLLAAHVVGFTNIDDRGAEGIEYANNKNLNGVSGQERIMRDRQGRVIEDVGKRIAAKNGASIVLSIDNRLQYFAYDALKAQVDKSNAKGGAAIVLDAKTGEVLAMVNMPTYNPNNRASATLDMLRNRAAIDIYEPGSIIKPLMIAKALDSEIVRPDTVFNTLPYSVGRKLIKDTHNYSQLSVAEIVQKSSDVGSSKIGLKFAPHDLWAYYNNIGFGKAVGTNFPGEAKGILHSWQNWRLLDQAEMSFGYAVSVSLLQMARAYTLFTNDGCMLNVSFYKSTNDGATCKQIISAKTAQVMRSILADVVQTGGTGTNAQVANYTTAGKTGTAHIATKGGYAANAYYGSFVGYAPANNPRIIVAVTIDNPRKGGYFGGTVAAPVFSEIVSNSLPALGVLPDKSIATSTNNSHLIRVNANAGVIANVNFANTNI